MNRNFQEELDSKLESFREWSIRRAFTSCRLVQYCGVECLGAIDVNMGDVEREIAGVFSEGFGVDWQENEGKLFLVVWEPANMDWNWACVFAEQDLEDLSNFDPPTKF